MTKDPQLTQAKKIVLDNLDVLEMTLDRCVDEGMIDSDSAFHNKLEDLLDDARIVNTWEELMELIAVAKNLEQDVDTWLSFHGQNTMGMSWPTRKITS